MSTKFLKYSVVLLFISVCLSSCEKDNDDNNIVLSQDITGCWINPEYKEDSEGKSIMRYEKTKSLPNNSYGVEFFDEGKLIERKSAGWCGTPPVTYTNYQGNWQVQENGDIKIDVAYWGGMEHSVWKIIGVTNKILTIEVVSMEYETTFE